VVREGLGRVTEDPKEAVAIIRALKNTEEFEKMKKNIKRVRKPTAAVDIAAEIMKYL
jgi:UDP-N-acetylglucosamine:LPS N-acetylglucosamine transferase